MKSLVRFVQSFKYARQGLSYTFATQPNMRFHMLAAFIASILTLLLPLPVPHILFVIAAVTLVIICELINTAVETVIDLVSPEYHPLAKITKDVAAAAVLVSAFFAVVTGILVFAPLLIQVMQDGLKQGLAVTLESVVAAAAVILLAVSASAGSARMNRAHHLQSTRQVSSDMNTEQERTHSGALNSEEQALFEQALQVRKHAYVPYSRFAVGSAIMAEDGQVYVGCNVENAAYGSTNCAERSALFHAISRGAQAKQFRMLAVVGDTEQPITPCGACRQVIVELCPPHMPLILGNTNGDVRRTTVAELLPGAFTKQSLND